MELTEEDILGIVDSHGATLGQVVRRLLDEVKSRQTQVTMDTYREMMGMATWTWDDDLGMHIPTCSAHKYDVRRGGVYVCGNGPLEGNAIVTGTCSDGPHLERHERSI